MKPYRYGLRVVFCAAVGGTFVSAGCSSTSPEPTSPTAEEAIIEAHRERPADPDLDQLFDQLNTLHFSGRLPDAKVMWSHGLDRLDIGDYRLKGVTDGRVILIKTALKDDDAEIRRTLCHEMVHVRLLQDGNRSMAHGSIFQNELRRVFDEGCFHAIWAPPEERASQKAWIDAERARLDAARTQAEAQGSSIERETERVERAFTDLNDRIRAANAAGSGWPSRDETEGAERQRNALNQSIVAYNAAVAATQADQARFNDAVQRYNLMMAYPDGLAEDRAKGLVR